MGAGGSYQMDIIRGAPASAFLKWEQTHCPEAPEPRGSLLLPPSEVAGVKPTSLLGWRQAKHCAKRHPCAGWPRCRDVLPVPIPFFIRSDMTPTRNYSVANVYGTHFSFCKQI